MEQEELYRARAEANTLHAPSALPSLRSDKHAYKVSRNRQKRSRDREQKRGR